MIDLWPALAEWVVRVLLAGGVVLALAAILILGDRHPRWRRGVALGALTAALLVPLLALAPAWLALPRWPEPALATTDPVAPPILDEPTIVWVIEQPTEAAAYEDVTLPEPEPTAATWSGSDLALLGYLVGVGFLLSRLLLAQIGLARLIARAQPAPPDLVAASADALALVRQPPRVLLVERLGSPACTGLWRPTILLPRAFVASADADTLRWALAHEADHLHRGDPLVVLGLALAKAVYFPVPWIWWLGRQVELCQEYLADAAAAATANDPADYAEFLVRLSRSRPAPLGAPAVRANLSDLFRRIDMVLNDSPASTPKRSPWWPTAGLLGLAAVTAGLGLTARPTPVLADGDKPPAEKRDGDRPKKEGERHDGDKPVKEGVRRDGEQPKKEAGRPQPGEAMDRAMRQMMEMLEGQDGLDENTRARIRKAFEAMRRPFGDERLPEVGDIRREMDELRKRVEEMRRAIGRGGDVEFDIVRPVPPAIMRRFDGSPPEGRLGVTIQPPTAVLADQLDLPEGQGLVVQDVVPGTPAAKAGLKPNDILLEFAGKPVPADARQLLETLGDLKPGKYAAVVLRKGRKTEIDGIALPEAARRAEEARPEARRLEAAPARVLEAAPAVKALRPVVVRVQAEQAGDRFTITQQQGEITLTLKGRLEKGRKVVESVTLADGDQTTTYDSVEALPEKYRDQVRRLLDGPGRE